MAERLGSAAIAPLLALATTDPDPVVRLAALETAAHFPLDEEAGAQLADAIRVLVQTTSPRSTAHRLATALATRLGAVSSLRRAVQFDPALVAHLIQSAVADIRQTPQRTDRLTGLGRLGHAGDRLSTPSASMASRDTPKRAMPPPSDERRVQLHLLQQGERRRTFIAGATHVIRCWIGPPQADAAMADQPIPEAPFPPDGLLLQVQLYWRDRHGHEHSDGKPMLLPADRGARSGDCDLHLTVPEDERLVSADLLFRYRGRVFEAVRLEAFVLPKGQAETPAHTLDVLVQTSRREVLGITDSPPVDATLVLDTPRVPGAESGAGLLVFDAHGARSFDLGGTSISLRWLNDMLHRTETVVARTKAKAGPPGAEELDDSDPTVLSLLRTLARHGANLYNTLRDSGFRDTGERLQVLNRTREPVPLEFVYDRGVPTEDAQLCIGWRDALRSDAMTCPVCSLVPLADDQRDHVSVLCPLGFWSLQKVIERIDPDEDGPGASVPTAARRSLRPIESALFACSDKVPEAERTHLWEALTRCVPQPTRVENWAQWKAAIKNDPALLLVLPHHDTDQGLDYLEIGATGLAPELARLGREQLSPSYINPDVTEPGPIVLMLGCQTAADTDIPTGQVELTRRVQQQHASIVLGTLAKVLGRHAAPVAQELIEQLAAVHDADSDFGTVMRRVRRRMLGRGYLMALCLVAIGDAQWRLAPAAD